MTKNFGDQFREDPRVQQAKKLLLEALGDYQAKLKSPREAQPDLVKSYQEMLDAIGELRGRALFYPYLSSGLGRGALVELADGSVKYDFITGIGVHYMGHSHPKMVEASIDAAIEDTVMQGNLQQNTLTVDLLNQFKTIACEQGAKLDHCFLTSSGAMANENAFKVIFQKHEPARRLIAFHHCFSGRSLATAQMTDKEKYREGIPKTIDIDYVPFFDANDPEGSTKKAVETLKELFAKYPKDHAGMCFELIQGEGGYYPGERNFFVKLMELCKANNVAVMVDEIQTFARTSKIFAFQHYELDEYVNVVTVGKSTQVCATLFTKDYNPRPGLLSQTFTSSTAAIHCAHAILKEFSSGDYFGEDGKVMKLSKHFTDQLIALSKVRPSWISGPFGLGAMIGFSIFDGSLEVSKTFLDRLYQAGVLAFIAGGNPTRVRFLMPVGCVTEKDIDCVYKIIEQTLDEMAKTM